MHRSSLSGLLAIFALWPLCGQGQGYITPGARVNGSTAPVELNATVTGTHASGAIQVTPQVSASITGGTNTTLLSGTTESLVFTPITTGTTTIAAGSLSVQLVPSISATGSLIATGTFLIDGATDALLPVIVARPGDTNGAITVILTSGTLRRIQR